MLLTDFWGEVNGNSICGRKVKITRRRRRRRGRGRRRNKVSDVGVMYGKKERKGCVKERKKERDV